MLACICLGVVETAIIAAVVFILRLCGKCVKKHIHKKNCPCHVEQNSSCVVCEKSSKSALCNECLEEHKHDEK